MNRFDKDIQQALDDIDSINPFATYLNDNTLSRVPGWIDTGSYVLNAIISGSIHGGIPKGRVTMLAGESMCLTKDQKIRVYKMRTQLPG